MIEWLADLTGLETNTTAKMIGTVVTIALLVVVRIAARRAVSRLEDHDASFRVNKGITYSLVIIGVLAVGWIWIDAFDNLATYFGLVSAGIAIGLSDLLKNIVGWAYILSRRPFKIGDRIELMGLIGDVVDIRLFRFSVLEVGGDRVYAEQSTGRLVHVPNGLVFTAPVANFTEGFAYVWHEVPLLITFESDWRRARVVLEKAMQKWGTEHLETSAAALRKMARQYNIKVGSLSPIAYMTVKDSGVLLSGRLLISPRERRAVDEAIWTEILDAFADDPDLHLAYPTVRNVVDLQRPLEA